MGLNAVVGTTHATKILKSVDNATIYCAGGEKGIIYENKLSYTINKIDVDLSKPCPIKLMMNVGNPESCFLNSRLPHKGIGLVRIEFIISNYIKIHPNALIEYPNIDQSIKNIIDEKIYNINPQQYYIKELAKGIAKIASAFDPYDVIVRFSDFNQMNIKI